MTSNPQPIYLFADSQLLFWKDGGALFIDTIRSAIPADSPKAAYIGASNGDLPEFYAIFVAAMEGIGIHDCKLIRSSLPPEDEAFLMEADLILLAGGDVEKGWNVIKEKRLDELLRKRYYDASILIGISAGAIQLGMYGIVEKEESSAQLIDTLKLVPFLIDAHDEAREWQRLTSVLRLLDGSVKALGIPAGGGLVYHPDHSVEVIRQAAYELSNTGGEVACNLLLPGKPQSS